MTYLSVGTTLEGEWTPLGRYRTVAAAQEAARTAIRDGRARKVLVVPAVGTGPVTLIQATALTGWDPANLIVRRVRDPKALALVRGLYGS